MYTCVNTTCTRTHYCMGGYGSYKDIQTSLSSQGHVCDFGHGPLLADALCEAVHGCIAAHHPRCCFFVSAAALSVSAPRGKRKLEMHKALTLATC